MRNPVGFRHVILVAIGLIVLLGGCRSKAPSPSINFGKAVCETCGMTVNDPRFAALFEDESTQQTFDSIECLLKGKRISGDTGVQGIWIMDFDTQKLCPASALTIVKADFPSPMGGGYAAFADAGHARAQTEAHRGQLGTLSEAISGDLHGVEP